MKRIALTLVLVAAATASAQAPSSMTRSRSNGFFLGAGFEGDGIRTNSDGAPTESGGGGGLLLGYGLNQRWSLFAQGSGATINAYGGGTYTLGHLDLGARVHFRTGPNIVVPFVQFGLSGRGMSEDVSGSNATATGGGFFGGGGLNVHMTPGVALSGSVTWTYGRFDDFKVNGASLGTGSFDATSARMQLGLVWFP